MAGHGVLVVSFFHLFWEVGVLRVLLIESPKSNFSLFLLVICFLFSLNGLVCV